MLWSSGRFTTFFFFLLLCFSSLVSWIFFLDAYRYFFLMFSILGGNSVSCCNSLIHLKWRNRPALVLQWCVLFSEAFWVLGSLLLSFILFLFCWFSSWFCGVSIWFAMFADFCFLSHTIFFYWNWLSRKPLKYQNRVYQAKHKISYADMLPSLSKCFFISQIVHLFTFVDVNAEGLFGHLLSHNMFCVL